MERDTIEINLKSQLDGLQRLVARGAAGGFGVRQLRPENLAIQKRLVGSVGGVLGAHAIEHLGRAIRAITGEKASSVFTFRPG